MPRVTRKEWYERVNAEWPAQVPPLTAEEAIRAGRKLYRFALRRTFTGKVRVTSGNRYTWIRRGEMVVNPEKGWHGLVHLLSHYADDRLRPDAHHDGKHARLELRMIREVKRRGWLNGTLNRPPKAPVERDPRQVRYARVLARISVWEAKQKRAVNALKKLYRQKRYYEGRIVP